MMTETDDQPTCGKGLAANATLPASIGRLLGAMADVLDNHQKALDPSDENARLEHTAYATLVRELSSIAEQLAATAVQMNSFRDLPMGQHDEEKMASREAADVFTRFVRYERELLDLIGRRVEEHEAMLEDM